MAATLEIYRADRWHPAARLTPADQGAGTSGACRLEYLHEYALAFSGPESAQATGLSCRFPTDFQLHDLATWPPFVLDILPSGYGRRQWLDQLDLADGPAADWPLLMHGTAFPPGNLRVAEAVAAKDPDTLVPTAGGPAVAMKDHPGFQRADILTRGEAFVEYAFQHGIYAAGASDVQGVAPKLLLTTDRDGRWHAEGRLADDAVQAHWLVKRPRGDRAADRKVLKNEAAYMHVANGLGLRVHSDLIWEDDHLFVPRFDREVRDGDVVRYGMESLYSAAGIAEFGKPVAHEVFCDVILEYCDDAETDLIEYIKRDVVNVVLGNKDNHGRNTALLRDDDGRTALSPLFDFAPMYLDPEGIARVCRWSADRERAGNPVWSRVIEYFPERTDVLRVELRRFGEQLVTLADLMHQCDVDDDIVEQRLPSIDANVQQLTTL